MPPRLTARVARPEHVHPFLAGHGLALQEFPALKKTVPGHLGDNRRGRDDRVRRVGLGRDGEGNFGKDGLELALVVGSDADGVDVALCTDQSGCQ